MKKLLLVLAIVLAVSVIFVSCNRDDKGTTPDTTTEAPTTGAPVVEDPTTEVPTTDGAEDPTTEAPTTDGGEETTTEAPTDEDPTTEAPTDEDLTTEAPTDDLPDEDDTTEAPTDDLPDEDDTTVGGEDDTTVGGEDDTTVGGEDDTTEAPTTEAPTDAPVEETIPFIGIISDINGLGKDGKKVNATNVFSETPHTFNPVTYYYPTVGDAWDYTARRLSVNGWALVEGGQGDLVWSDDGGLTWKKVTNVTFTDATDAEEAKGIFGEMAKTGGLKSYNTFDVHFSLTIDLSGYADDEYVTIWIGRENADGKAVAIFKFSEMMIGDEVHVPETCPVCGNMHMDDVMHPVRIVSFDTFKSSHSITDAQGLTDRIRVRPYTLDPTGVTSYCNSTPDFTWNKTVRILEKDIFAGHTFTIEGWVGLTEEVSGIDFCVQVWRNGELYKTNGGDPVAAHPDVIAAAQANACKTASQYKIWLGVEDLQDGDSIHFVMMDTVNNKSYCFRDFTLNIVADNTDLWAAASAK